MHQEVTLTDGQHNAVNVLLQRVRQKCCVKFGSKRRDKKWGWKARGRYGNLHILLAYLILFG